MVFLVGMASALHVPPGGARRMPRHIKFAPSAALSSRHVELATLLDTEIARGITRGEKKQKAMGVAEQCMAAYVKAPMTLKAEALETWSKLVLANLHTIPEGVAEVTLELRGKTVTLRFDLSKYASPREEALEHAAMAVKLRRQQGKVDALRHLHGGTVAALGGWQKRVRIAAARGEAAALGALHSKLLESSKRLGLRADTLQAFDADELGI